MGQAFCGYALLIKKESVTWRESGAAFLFFAVGAGISLVSQIYNLPGDVSSFLLTWMLLCLPLIYVMKSSFASLLYLVGITYSAVNADYWSYPSTGSFYYWILLLLALPHYYLLIIKTPGSNFMIFHNWILPWSVTITLGTVAHTTEELMFVAYMSLFGFFSLIGETAFFEGRKLRTNGYLFFGSLGTISVLLALSFDWIWENIRSENFQIKDMISSPEFIAALLVSVLAGGLFIFQMKKKSFIEIIPINPIFNLFIIVFVIGLYSSIAVILINLLVLTVGILTIRKGAKRDHLGILNFGLLIITALVICRFFDTDLSFITRGLLFVIVGIGFFVSNSWILKKRKVNA